MAIFIKSSTKKHLIRLNIDYSELIQDFYHMIMGSEVFFFGRNVQDTNILNFFHVHYLPNDSQQLKIWSDNYKYHKDPFTRTSDNLLFYAKNQNDYLILELISPNGHSVFSSNIFLNLMKYEVENFVNYKIIP